MLDPFVGMPSLLLWLAASAPEAVGEREWHSDICGRIALFSQPVGRPDSSDGRALVWFAEDLGLILGLGLKFFHIYL